MATNVFAGKDGSWTVVGTSTGTGAEFGGFKNGTLSVEHRQAEVTHTDTSGWVERIDTFKSWSFTCTVAALSTAATQEQDTLRTKLSSGTKQWFAFKNSTGAGSQTFSGYGRVAGYDLSWDENDIELYNFSIMGDGKITES